MTLRAQGPSRVLLTVGQPLAEPIIQRGPFVMNTPEGIVQAIADYSSGRMGRPSGA